MNKNRVVIARVSRSVTVASAHRRGFDVVTFGRDHRACPGETLPNGNLLFNNDVLGVHYHHWLCAYLGRTPTIHVWDPELTLTTTCSVILPF